MIVNRKFRERLLLVGAIILTSSTVPLATLAQDRSRGWEGANAEEDSRADQRNRRTDSANNGRSGRDDANRYGKTDDRGSDTQSDRRGGSSFNDRISPKGTTEASATAPFNDNDDAPDIYQAGDTAFNTGKFSDALQRLDDAWRKYSNTKPSSRTTAQFFERKALALRGMQQLTEAERLLKQAVGHVTTNGTRDQDLRARILFELADIQNQEGMPKDAVVTANQALTAMGSGGLTKIESLLAIETANTLGRSLTDSGDIKGADASLDEAFAKAGNLPPSSNVNLPPQSSASKFGDVVMAKVKVNRYYLKDTRGGGGKLKRDLDDAISVFKNYAPTSAPDARYSLLTLQLEKNEPTIESVDSALAEAQQLPGADNLVEAAILMKRAELKLRSNEPRAAAEALSKALAIRTKVLPAYSIHVAETLVKLSEAQLRSGKSADAAASAQKAMSALERSAGRKTVHFARANLALASVYMAASKFGQVEPLLLESVNTLTAIRGRGDSETVRAINLLCSAYIRNNKYSVAMPYAEHALTASEKFYAPNAPELVLPLTNIGTVESHLKKFPEANAHLQRAANILTRNGKSNTPEFADVLASTGVSYTLQKKWVPAANAFKQARSIYTTAYGARSPYVSQMNELLKTMEALKAGPRIPGHNILLENKFKPSSPHYR